MIADAQLRAWWWHIQGLNSRLRGQSAASILSATGWARSVGGVCAYLTLFSRGDLGREAVDGALASRSINELPSARACTYVMSAECVALALRACLPFKEPEIRKARKLGVTEEEQDELCNGILDALSSGPQMPAALRANLRSVVRNLGEAGSKQGIATTLPFALGLLQAQGRIRRISANGRLDGQRYLYARWDPSPLPAPSPSRQASNTELARKYFEWTAPATLSGFRWFSGLGVRDAKAAVEPLGLVPLSAGGPMYLSEHQRERLMYFEPSEQPDVHLLSSLDGLFLLRRNAASLIEGADGTHRRRRHHANGLTDLRYHAIVDRG